MYRRGTKNPPPAVTVPDRTGRVEPTRISCQESDAPGICDSKERERVANEPLSIRKPLMVCESVGNLRIEREAGAEVMLVTTLLTTTS
jgi:hypothetical protein